MIPKVTGQPGPRKSKMAGTSVKQFLEILKQSRILDPEQLQEIARDILPKMGDPRGLARELVRRGWMTAFQVNQVSQGHAADLLVGQYLILERLGEGGMGQVYKARHRAMGRVVALKVMRPERLSNPDAINRFRREIRAAAQLSHPNVVLAYDADEVNGKHYFAMEFVEGVDLSRLVKARGPVPIKDACNYIYQTAVGLEHAHERGLVHRDIKPANLLVTPVPKANNAEEGTVKILDMGLARLGEITEDSAYTQLTQDGKVVGTPDYISPEQARDSRKADIRSDLYSLGCTFYYLLTAKVPFPGGTSVMEKLMKHQMEEPVPIETIRAEVPEGIRAVLRKLITKRQQDRYQTPRELVKALEPFAVGNALPTAITSKRAAPPPSTMPPLAIPLGDPQSANTPQPHLTPDNFDRSPGGIAVEKTPAGPSAASKFLDVAVRTGKVAGVHLGKGLAWLAVLMVRPGPSKQRQMLRGVIGGCFGLLLAVWAIQAMFFPGASDVPENGSEAVASALDKLKHADIPAAQHFAGMPEDLVGVVGDGRGQHWVIGGQAQQLVYSPDGKYIASGGWTGAIRLWDAETLRPAGVLRGSDSSTLGNLVFRDPHTLVSASTSGSVNVWDLRPGQTIGSQLKSYRFPKHQILLSADGRRGVALEQNQMMRLDAFFSFDVATGNKSKSAPVPSNRFAAAVISPHGKYLAIRVEERLRLTSSVIIWDLENNKEQARLSGVQRMAKPSFSPDGSLLAISMPPRGMSGNILVIECSSGKQDEVRGNLPAFVSQLDFTPDNRTLVLAGATLSFVDVKTGAVRSPDDLRLPGFQIRDLRITPDGRTVLVASAREGARLFDIGSGRQLARPPGALAPTSAGASAAFSPDSQTLGYIGQNNTIRLWGIHSGKEILPRRTNGGVTLLGLLPDSNSLAVGHIVAEEGKSARIVQGVNLASLESKNLIHDTSLPQGPWAYVPAQRKVVGESAMIQAGNSVPAIKVWDIENGEADNEFPVGRSVRQGNHPTLAVSPDGASFAAIVIGRDNNGRPGINLVVADTKTGAEKASIPLSAAGMRQLAFSAGGKELINLTYDRDIQIWNIATKERRQLNQLEGVNTDVFCFAISPDGKNAASANARNGKPLITLWDYDTGQAKQTINIESVLPVQALSFSPDGKILVGSTFDGKLLLWDTATGESLKDWRIPGPVQHFVFTPDSRYLFTGNANGTVYIFRVK